MNRDDARERPEAAPSLWTDGQITFAAPRDLQAGGTWIGVNANGIAACLLNRYDGSLAGYVSRGRIVIEAIQGSTFKAACGALEALDHGAFSPFTCIIVDRSNAARFDWTGSSFERSELPRTDVMATSSSWQFDDVKRRREARFREIWASSAVASDRVAAFHGAQEPTHDAWAPMMQRPQSHTKSITQVAISESDVEMRYWTRESVLARGLEAPDTTIQLST
jgi:uncharacterized protein with NRDE domain